MCVLSLCTLLSCDSAGSMAWAITMLLRVDASRRNAYFLCAAASTALLRSPSEGLLLALFRKMFIPRFIILAAVNFWPMLNMCMEDMLSVGLHFLQAFGGMDSYAFAIEFIPSS